MPSFRDATTSAATLVILCITVAGNSHAESLSYVLDQSSNMPDDIGYLQVTIADGRDGAVDFTLRLLQPLQDLAGKNLGIRGFSFNLAPGARAEAMDVTGLPKGWRARNGGRLSGFGMFDISLKGHGAHPVDQLSFSITDVDLDAPKDYVSLSTGHVTNDSALFAAVVHGMRVAATGSRSTFGASAVPSAVPAPASVWLLASALGLVGGLRRRRGPAPLSLLQPRMNS